MTRAIGLTTCNRPDYLRQCLEYLKRCRGAADCILFANVEPGCEESAELVRAVDWCDCRPHFNAERIGCGHNTIATWDRAFAAGAESIVYLDDDILLSEDALEYFRWAEATYRADPAVFSVTAYNRLPEPPAVSETYRAARRIWFHPWGTLIWRDRWAAARHVVDGQMHRASYDGLLTFDHVQARSLVEIYPVLSRAQNIGLVSAVRHPGLTPEWYAEHHRLKHWARGPVPPGSYFERRAS